MEKILELRRFEQSQAEAELGKVNAQIAQIQQKLEAIAVKKISSTKEFNTDSNIMVMNQLQNYFYMLDQKKEECLEEMAKLELVAEEKREAVRKCMQNVKVLEKLKEKGVEFAEVNLNVGLGTFRPVKVDNLEEHKMHTEYYEITEENAEKINRAKREGRRVIAVGTTSVRTLETVADSDGYVKASSGNTSIFIYPPYKFKCVDNLITNFHLPESTLIMLVSAFSTREKILEVYKTAVEEKYRFFSFGDSMFIV